MPTNTSLAAKEFFKRVKHGHFGLVSDDAWPSVAESVISDFQINTLVDLIDFWKKLRAGFRRREKSTGNHLHKGQIDWILAQLYLAGGDIQKTLKSLDNAVQEDDQRAPDQYLAAYSLRSILKPIIYRFDKRQHWSVKNRESLQYFNSLTTQESNELKRIIFEVHNQAATGQALVINDFQFITNVDLQTFVEKTYNEVAKIILAFPANSYYASVITIGSILETILGDLIERSPHISQSKKRKAAKSGLGTMIGIIRGEQTNPLMPRETLLLCEIICEYRNLVHYNHAIANEHNLGRYLASYLLTLLAHIGHHCWPASNP